MATRWIVVCDSATQPALDAYGAMQCSQSGGTLSVMSVDTVISESSSVLNLLALTPEDASLIAIAIAMLWSMMWGFKQVIRALTLGVSNEKDD